MAESIGKVVIYILGYILIVISLIPLIRNDNWIFRIFEYPRAQKLVTNVILAIAFLFFIDFQNTHDVIFICLLILNAGYLIYQIWPYTILSKHQLHATNVGSSKKKFRLLICNVFQDNRDVKSCIRTINAHQPDIILLVETDQWWKKELDSQLIKNYHYRISKPLGNTYGMLLYSKFELLNPEVKFLVERDIPSIHTKVKLPSGDLFQLYGLHPKPPVPGETSRSTERDAEILMVAKRAKNSRLPVVVAGDLNDVAWSYTTALFLKTSELLDPRRGRGFYSTFHAQHWFFRWPLDHVFCSHHFQLCNLKRLPQVGSDHFPILIELVLKEEKSKENKKEILKADSDEQAMAEEKIEKANAS